MWNTEFNDRPSVGKTLSVEDKQALRVMEDTVTLDEGHYMLALPWKNQRITLPNNRALAETRLSHLKRKSKRDSDLHKRYSKQIDDYLSKGYASEVPNGKTGDRVWYLPHHAVANENKPNKVRVVFDAAARYEHTSLNENLLQGPGLINNLYWVLMRFRQERIAIVSDIEAMFHQVRVAKWDRNALHFL